MILVISESCQGVGAIPQTTVGVSWYVGLGILEAILNDTLPCLSVDFIFCSHALFKMAFGKIAEKLAAVDILCVYHSVYHMKAVCVWGMNYRFERVVLTFHTCLCALSFVSTVMVTVTHVLGSWRYTLPDFQPSGEGSVWPREPTLPIVK